MPFWTQAFAEAELAAVHLGIRGGYPDPRVAVVLASPPPPSSDFIVSATLGENNSTSPLL
jgi:hypothetical protein